MATRCGAIDPGVLIYLLKHEGVSADRLEQMLYRESGLLGVSARSADVRDLYACPDEKAKEAIELFTASVAKETAAMANSLRGLAAIVFTGGIGEYGTDIRADVCARLEWLGVKIDADANQLHEDVISRDDSLVAVFVMATDEEIMIARHTMQLMRAAR